MPETTAIQRFRGPLWAALYFVMAVAPLPIALWRHTEDGRGFWIELGVALGFAGLAMMGLQFALTARFRWIGRGVSLDDMMQVHRQAGILAVAFVLAHPVILLAAHPAYFSFLDPRVNAPRTIALVVATAAVILLLVLPLYRRRLGISYEWWRLTHSILAFLAVFVGLGHVLMVGHYVSGVAKPLVWIAMTGGALLLLAHTRIVRPIAVRRRPWRVAEVRPEGERVWSIAFEAEGHPGLSFSPGQFVWLSLESSPLSLQQHPFTIASSAERGSRIELTIKELGDFTQTIRDVEPGALAFLEGPYGQFTPDGISADATVFVVGGIGVTPAMSTLRTMRDRGQTTPIVVVYGAVDLDRLVFRDELESLTAELDLELVYVLDEPPPDWQGERGPFTADTVARIRQRLGAADAYYFICGPEPMMDVVESTLAADGVPRSRVHAERFNLV